jgi:predicted TIM-barrel fold metal-dependent hydrolase
MGDSSSGGGLTNGVNKPTYEAIDVHVHVATGDRLRGEAADTATQAAARAYFGAARAHVTADEVAEMYRGLRARAVIFDVDTEARTGRKVSNDDIADAVKRHPDVLIGFATVDPWRANSAIREVRRAVEVLGLRGLKLHPGIQAFAPNDHRFYPLYEMCANLKIPIIFHTGMSGIGAGMPGGDGIRLKYTQPLLLDDVAVDFPQLTIIGAHPSWPWQEEMLAIARHKSNVYIDLSGWAPKYFPPSLVQQANSLLQDKCLFGSDFPLIPTERWLKEFGELPLKDSVRPKILRTNAERVLGLT